MFLRQLGFLLVALGLAWAGAAPSWADVPRMTKEELKPLLGKPGVAVIDVRAGRDWEGSGEKIAGAVRHDPDAAGEWAPKYGKDHTLVLYCA